MKAASFPLMAALFLASLGCTTTPAPQGADGARAEIRDAGGRIVATAALRDEGGSIRVHVDSAGLAAGTYGIHVHATGLCEAPGFTTAGTHWNPSGRQHGRDNPQGAHMGDLPNLVVDASAHGSVDYAIGEASLGGGANPLLDADGAAVVVHAQADDYRTDPSGNSGPRIACGILSRG